MVSATWLSFTKSLRANSKICSLREYTQLYVAQRNGRELMQGMLLWYLVYYSSAERFFGMRDNQGERRTISDCQKQSQWPQNKFIIIMQSIKFSEQDPTWISQTFQ